MSDFTIKAGDLLPLLSATLTYSDGTPVVLTGASVVFVLRSQTTGTVAVSSPAVVTNAGAGGVSYTWQTGDTTTPGRYSAEWQVTVGGKRQTFPTDGYLPVVVEESLSSTSLPTRLVSLSDTRNHLNLVSGDTSNDAQLLGFIDAARAVIEDMTGPVIPVTKTEFFDGGGPYVVLSSRYIVSISSVFENRGLTNYPLTDQELGSSVDAFGFSWDQQTSTILRRSFGGSTVLFAPGQLNVAVTYVAGLTAIPANLRLAALELIRHWWQQGQQASWPMPGGGDNDIELPAASLSYSVPNRVKELVNPHKRSPAVG